MKFRNLFWILALFIFLIALNVAISSPGSAAEKAGAKCTTFGKSLIQGKIKLTCVRVSEYKWVATPIKPTLGSVYNPILPGAKFKIDLLQFQSGTVNFEFGEEVCLENIFNDGCYLNPETGSTIDPNSSKRWISVDLLVTNLSKKIISGIDLNYSYYLILPNGKYIESDVSATYQNSPIEIRLIPNINTKMRVGFFVTKDVSNLNPIIVIRNDTLKISKDYFFYLNW